MIVAKGTMRNISIAVLVVSSLLTSPAARADFGFVLETGWSVAKEPVRTLAFAPDGSWFVAGVGRQGVVFDLEGGRPRSRGELLGSRKEILGAAVSPDGRTIALVDAAGSLLLYDADSLAPVVTVARAHSGEALTVSFTGDSAYVLTGGEDGKVKAWTRQGAPFADLSKGARHERGVVFVAGVPPGRSAISVGRDRRVILWQVDTQQAVRPTLVEMDVKSAAVGGGGTVLALGLQLLTGNRFRSSTFANAHEIKTADRVRLVDAGNGTQLRELEGGDQDLDAVAVTPDGRFVASAGSGKFASIWDAATGRLVTNIPFDEPATALAFAPDGRWMVTGTEEGALSLYRLSGVGPAVLSAPGGKIIIIIIDPQTGGQRGEVPRVETPSLRVKGRIKSSVPIKSLLVDGHEITSIVQNESGDYLFTANVSLPTPGKRQVEILVEDQAGVTARESLAVERAREVRPLDPRKGRRLALIVGISKYADPTINLEYADDDAEALFDLLTSSTLGPAAFRKEDVKILLDEKATVANINSGLREFLQKARENDFVLFFFAGHGVPDPNRIQDLYLMAHDTRPGNVAGTGLLMRHVREAIAEIEARDVLILTDACHSAGMAAPKSIRNLSVNPIHQVFLDKMVHASGGLAILTASEAAQVSLESPKTRHGIFTDFLLKGLRGAADADGDNIITLGESMEYVRDNVRKETGGRQIPSIGPTSFDRQLPLVIVPP